MVNCQFSRWCQRSDDWQLARVSQFLASPRLCQLHDFTSQAHVLALVGWSGLHVSTHLDMRSPTETCVAASLFQSVQDTPPKRDPSLLMVNCLSPQSVTSESTKHPAAPESKFALRHFISNCPTSSSQSLISVLRFARPDAHTPPVDVINWDTEARADHRVPRSLQTRIVCKLKIDFDAVLPPRASDCLKHTSNDGQHEVQKCSCQLPHSQTRLSPRQLSRTIRLRFSCARPGRDIRHQRLRYHVVTTVNCAEDAIHRKVEEHRHKPWHQRGSLHQRAARSKGGHNGRSSALRQLKTCVRVQQKRWPGGAPCVCSSEHGLRTRGTKHVGASTTQTRLSCPILAAHRPPGLVGVVDDSECDMAR